jgi:7-keto-8-aminopelargonate synthetase-like enzyme
MLIEQPLRPEKLQATAELLRRELAAAGMPAAGGRTQIIPLIIGDADTAVRLAEAVLARGVFAPAIRPPTVPEGTSRLRLTVMASHTATELAGAVAALGAAAADLGITVAAPPSALEPVARAA